MKALDSYKLNPKQQDILLQLYRHRYLNTRQIQKLMNAKAYRTVNVWLKELKENNYVLAIPWPAKGQINSPLVYFTGGRGISYLRARSDTTDVVCRRLVSDKQLSFEFIDRKLLAADIAGELTRSERYEIATGSSIANPVSGAHWLYQMGLSPDLVVRSEATGRVYLAEVLVASMPTYAMRRLVNLYLEAIESSDWELWIVFVCDNRGQIGIVYRGLRATPERYRWQVVAKDETRSIRWT